MLNNEYPENEKEKIDYIDHIRKIYHIKWGQTEIAVLFNHQFS